MIVKTGANYQAEGGYIEASRDGDIITIDGNEYNTENGLFSVGLLNIVNEGTTEIDLYAGLGGDADNAPVYYARAVEAGSRRQYQVFYPGRVFISTSGSRFDSTRSIGCELAGSDYLRVFAVNATAYFI